MSGLRLLHVQTGCPPARLLLRPVLDGTGLPAGCNLLRIRGELSDTVLQRTAPQIAVVEHFADRSASLRTVRCLRTSSTSLPIILIAWESCEDFVIDAFNAGISKYLKLPGQLNQLYIVLNELIQQLCAPECSDSILINSSLIGTSSSICELRRYISQIAPSDSNVLITGETGTGKELVAQLIKDNSARRNRPFICLNSAAIPDALVESELFGYQKGAFTGAFTAQEGKLAAANHGTVFFDEIGDVSPNVQAKLLRAIESKKIYRLGSNRSCDLDVRILAASNQDLEAATQQNRFRTDLYYRLNVIRIEVPPLREHVEDLPVLVDHYLRLFSKKCWIYGLIICVLLAGERKRVAQCHGSNIR
jgi:DNA-binding NtrC family response regulator